ncbi:hypothetical protein F2Q69_00041727 [Brassica cretica]|uniref:DUF1985 domain-containing protein n=1 Tax=Brassica cretica TaxID=69181 RepID=A0A8S9NRG9_BRACR|nr:hypothetical protein F2Q69_00041727 [Brassica cretica]
MRLTGFCVSFPSSVPKKKGRLVGLGRRTRSVPPSSAPPPFVDPEVLTAQLKDKDDRISLLETQMAAQQAGYEAQRRLNQQMMEMMQRMYPNEGLIPRNIPRDLFLGIFRGFKFRGNEPSEYSEGHVPRNIPRDTFLGIYRGTCSSEFSEGSFPRKFPMKIPRNISSKPPRFRRLPCKSSRLPYLIPRLVELRRGSVTTGVVGNHIFSDYDCCSVILKDNSEDFQEVFYEVLHSERLPGSLPDDLRLRRRLLGSLPECRKMDLPELSLRIHTLGEEPPAGKSILFHTHDSKLFATLRKALHADEYEELKESKLGVFIKFKELKFGWASRQVHYMLGFQLDIKKKYKLWSLVGPQPVRFSLLEFEHLTGLNCDYIEDLENPRCEVTKEMAAGASCLMSRMDHRRLTLP